jgi:hypothetical protein
MSAAKPVCNPAVSGIRRVNEYSGSAKLENEKKKLSPPGKLKEKAKTYSNNAIPLFTAWK